MRRLLSIATLILLVMPSAASAATSTQVTLDGATAVLRKGDRPSSKVIVAVHGGGWHRGDRGDTARMGLDARFLAKGYDVLAVRKEVLGH